MKTKEEILEPYLFVEDGSTAKIAIKAEIIEAMQTYADQECAAKDAEIAELKKRIRQLEAERGDLHNRLIDALDGLG